MTRAARGKAWQELHALIEDSKYVELSNNLVLPPMDDLRQAVLYIPSALLKVKSHLKSIVFLGKGDVAVRGVTYLITYWRATKEIISRQNLIHVITICEI
jgi:hypothetical protein